MMVIKWRQNSESTAPLTSIFDVRVQFVWWWCLSDTDDANIHLCKCTFRSPKILGMELNSGSNQSNLIKCEINLLLSDKTNVYQLLKPVKEEECIKCRGALHHINMKGRRALKAKGEQNYIRQIAVSKH